MPDVSLDFIARQLGHVLAEQRGIRDELRGVRLDLRSLREEFSLLREQVRLHGDAIKRLDDTITMNVLDRLQILEGHQRDA